MTKLLLTAGCSFSALYYHSNPCESYTVRLANALEHKLINLAIPGGGVDTVYRKLREYLANPLHGMPTLVFVQMPFSDRKEYWFDRSNDYVRPRVEHEINTAYRWQTTNYPRHLTGTGKKQTGGRTAQETDWWNLEQTLVAMLETHKGVDTQSTDWHYYLSTDKISNKHESAHDLIHLFDHSQRIVHLHTYAHLIEELLESYDIPYCYTESDYIYKNDQTSCFDNKRLKRTREVYGAFEYCKNIPHKKHFIPDYSIAHGSSTWQADNYPCDHPGPQSHYEFYKAIMPHVKKRIN